MNFPWPALTVAVTVSPTALDANDTLPTPTVVLDPVLPGYTGRAQAVRTSRVPGPGSVAADVSGGGAKMQEVTHGAAVGVSVASGNSVTHEVSRGRSVAAQHK